MHTSVKVFIRLININELLFHKQNTVQWASLAYTEIIEFGLLFVNRARAELFA